MAKVLWLLIGVLLGAVAAQQLSRNPQGRRVLAAVNGTAGEFAQTVADSYRARRDEAGTS
ncbi:hypothetical protein QDR37_10240 [Amnibacterium sp. CER49]|uniref:hypothetical protein n=1 Tax=Amnibacterium sp. CER49 TaxID=3039161 RepID=UPI00244B4C8F|nr:hypothetical protein [Amnibacterium sp. CER49]MDH2444320.1 hypothetical protein [Amnibacterium sp. CER49]